MGYDVPAVRTANLGCDYVRDGADVPPAESVALLATFDQESVFAIAVHSDPALERFVAPGQPLR